RFVRGREHCVGAFFFQRIHKPRGLQGSRQVFNEPAATAVSTISFSGLGLAIARLAVNRTAPQVTTTSHPGFFLNMFHSSP
ncbi:MAG: hypothetical protein WBU20_02300, partial [Candidatus Acidiferrum sp.]